MRLLAICLKEFTRELTENVVVLYTRMSSDFVLYILF